MYIKKDISVVILVCKFITRLEVVLLLLLPIMLLRFVRIYLLLKNVLAIMPIILVSKFDFVANSKYHEFNETVIHFIMQLYLKSRELLLIRC